MKASDQLASNSEDSRTARCALTLAVAWPGPQRACSFFSNLGQDVQFCCLRLCHWTPLPNLFPRNRRRWQGVFAIFGPSLSLLEQGNWEKTGYHSCFG